jgi:hypothetical protein
MAESTTLTVRKGVSQARDPVVAARELHDAICTPDTAFAFFFCSPEYDLTALGAELGRLFGGVTLVGCTTAGEITPTGYLTGALTGAGISGGDITAVSARLDNLGEFELAHGEIVARDLMRELSLRGRDPRGRSTFAFLVIDGLSLQEEAVVSALYQSLGDIPLFGGSAGDGTRFGSTFVYHGGAFHRNSAVITLVSTSAPFEVFKTEHFVPTDKKMVVTGADPARRVVTEINGLPAGREYARMVGLEVDKLTPLIFACYPVVVRLGGKSYVRAIQKVNEDESLTFFCAIDEGIVLTVGQRVDLVENLRQLFDDLESRIGHPQLVIGCDCILRHLELDQMGLKPEVDRILQANNVIGFSTYGEQLNAMHINQTFTGVAIGSPR